MNAAGPAQPAPDTITGTLNSSAVIGAAAVAMQKNTEEIPSDPCLSTTLCPSGLTTSTWVAIRHSSLAKQVDQICAEYRMTTGFGLVATAPVRIVVANMATAHLGSSGDTADAIAPLAELADAVTHVPLVDV